MVKPVNCWALLDQTFLSFDQIANQNQNLIKILNLSVNASLVPP